MEALQSIPLTENVKSEQKHVAKIEELKEGDEKTKKNWGKLTEDGMNDEETPIFMGSDEGKNGF